MKDASKPGMSNGLNRRDLLVGAGAAATTLASTPLLAAAATSDLERVKQVIGPIDPKHSGKGMTFDLGWVTALTGPGAIYGPHLTDLAKVAFKQIEAMGGPKFNLILKDNKSGDPQAGAQAVRELGFAKVPAMISAYAADLGAMLTGIKRYKIFSVDGTGGTSVFAQGKPYYWGSIAITPNDAFPGVYEYIKRAMPNVKTTGSVGWDLGGLSDAVFEAIRDQMGATLKTYKQLVDERVKIGATDYSAAIQKLKAAKPDVVFLIVYAEDVGYFMKQYATSGINKPVFTFSHTEAAAKIAGKAYEGLYTAFDYFDAEHPTNPWSKFFVDQFSAYAKQVTGTAHLPDYYTANTYEDIFIIWDCIRRVLAAGGNPHDGEQLDKALRNKPIFPSLYGGDSSHAGTIEFDLASHSVKRRGMSISRYTNGRLVQKASFNIKPLDFKLL